MQVCQDFTSVFDDPNLVSCAGLAPVMALAQRAGLHDLVTEHVKATAAGGVNAHLKVPALIGGMIAGADSIDDMDLLRHGGMGRLFGGVRAPSTLGTFLRSLNFGNVRQLDAVASRLLVNLARSSPLLPGADQICYVDIDDTIRQTYGYAKQGASYGYSKVKGLNAIIVIASTPLAAPVILASRLRKGSSSSAHGAGRIIADALVTATRTGATGLKILRADSAYYNHEVVAACSRGGARFSITARHNTHIDAAISRIAETAWTPIQYPNAIWDEDEGRLVSDAEVAEIEYTAFTSRRKSEHVTARLIVRRVRRLNPAHAAQGEFIAGWRYHCVFTNSPLGMLEAETDHRKHAIIEQVNADLKDSALAHLPSKSFASNSAWLVCAAMAFNLTRAAGTLAGTLHAKARTGTIRAQLINVPARLARSARRLTLHLPTAWPWAPAWAHLATLGDP
jgi:hypothetical protein